MEAKDAQIKEDDIVIATYQLKLYMIKYTKWTLKWDIDCFHDMKRNWEIVIACKWVLRVMQIEALIIV